jgi:hypothetical protein
MIVYTMNYHGDQINNAPEHGIIFHNCFYTEEWNNYYSYRKGVIFCA